mmetsp:Transcript_41378/g.131612  ORF Transcript_41378/g.131612 Transcript_41378/m.131612 type:complete len:213 (+) Transcript_41378:448-1086(+)
MASGSSRIPSSYPRPKASVPAACVAALRAQWASSCWWGPSCLWCPLVEPFTAARVRRCGPLRRACGAAPRRASGAPHLHLRRPARCGIAVLVLRTSAAGRWTGGTGVVCTRAGLAGRSGLCSRSTLTRRLSTSLTSWPAKPPATGVAGSAVSSCHRLQSPPLRPGGSWSPAPRSRQGCAVPGLLARARPSGPLPAACATVFHSMCVPSLLPC